MQASYDLSESNNSRRPEESGRGGGSAPTRPFFNPPKEGARADFCEMLSLFGRRSAVVQLFNNYFSCSSVV